MTLTRLVPMLHVSDVERSLGFYRDHLGFTLVSPESALREYGWAHIRRDGVDLMLAGGLEGGPIRRPGATTSDWPVMFYFYPDDVESLHRALGSRGVDVGELCVTFYRMKEFSLLDPDGHMLTFGQETDEPPTPEEDEAPPSP
jgi:catechol 2,3-dioxygenase-like lactoylglutathione lyase family enzyme